MLGDLQPDGWQLEDLPALAMRGGKLSVYLAHGGAALRAAVLLAETMLNDMIGIGFGQLDKLLSGWIVLLHRWQLRL